MQRSKWHLKCPAGSHGQGDVTHLRENDSEIERLTQIQTKTNEGDRPGKKRKGGSEGVMLCGGSSSESGKSPAPGYLQDREV